jgi:dUTP pyrophosphatase
MAIPITVNIKVEELLAKDGVERVGKQVQEDLAKAFSAARKSLRTELGATMLGERIQALANTKDVNNPAPGVHISHEPVIVGGVSYEDEQTEIALVDIANEQLAAEAAGNVVEAAGTATLAPPLLQFKRLHADAVMPKRAHGTDAGFDLTAVENAVLAPGGQVTVKVGLAVAIPAGYVGLVCPRSGLAAKFGITITNAPGIIDSGYRGELMVILHNTSSNTFEVEAGDRIAQLVVTPFLPALSVEVDSLPAADRGDAGFGSTGT